ncbi:hypothetical protein B484DRAFT_152274 [Ochromonadaceae sp. CCMP2298]|nr:hypothetical protein B484DRAFT_152274 [Ochromonadaceae sp. CCMP2298]
MKRVNSSLHRAHSRDSFSRLLFESESSNGGGDESRSIFFRLCQLGVLAFRLVTPFSYLYLSTLFALKLQPAQFFGGSAMYYFLLVWMLVEALFLPYYYYLFTQLSKRNGDLEHFASDKQSRFLLVRNCLEAMLLAGPSTQEPEVYIRKALEGWFMDFPLSDVKRGNMAAWTGWAFFGMDPGDMSKEEAAENEEMVQYLY